MRIFSTILSVAIAVAGLSCGGDAQSQGQSNAGLSSGAEPIVGGIAPTHADPAPKAQTAARLEGDAPPPDARFTIFCEVYRGEDHVIRSTRVKEELMRKYGLRAWHILHTELQSVLCFGYYRTYDDREHEPKEVARAHADMQIVNGLKDPQGDRLFKLTLFETVDEQDPESPAAWNLANAPSYAYWSLQIAAYKGSIQRKQAAVDAVRLARSQGVEAYYYHGDTISSVCIRAWPREAVKEQDAASAHSVDPNATLLIPSEPLPQFTSPEMRDREGNRLTILAPKLELNDPGLAKAIAKYPEHSVNGEVHVIKAADGQLIPNASFLVVIPRDAIPDPIVPLKKLDPASGADRAATDILDNPTIVQKPGNGKLRSLGD